MKKFDQFQEGMSVLAWCRSIFRIEVLRAKQQWGRERSLVERLLDDATLEKFHTTQRQNKVESWQEALEHCFAHVPERERRVLRTRFMDELSYQRIVELGLQVHSVGILGIFVKVASIRVTIGTVGGTEWNLFTRYFARASRLRSGHRNFVNAICLHCSPSVGSIHFIRICHCRC